MAKEQGKGMTEEKIRAFEARREALKSMGGEKMIAKQHELGKMTAHLAEVRIKDVLTRE